MRTWIGYAHPDRLLSYPDDRYLSGCVSIPDAGPPTSAATRPTTHARVGPTPHRRCHKLRRGLQSRGGEKQRVLETDTGTKLSLHGQNSPNSTILVEQGEFCHGQRPQSSSTGHVLSGHQLYARTLIHWLTRPPATPSMGRRHTRGQRGLAAVPVGGGGAWPGFEIDHSEPKARVWRSRGRAAAHGHTKQPGGCTSTQRGRDRFPGLGLVNE